MYVSKIHVRECSNDDQVHLFRPALPGRRIMPSFILVTLPARRCPNLSLHRRALTDCFVFVPIQ